MRACIIFYPEVGSVLGRMLQADEGLKFQQFALRAKVDQRQAVAEYVVNPSDFRRLGNDIQTAIEQSLIEAIAWAEQELMQARSYWSFVAIRRLMMYREHRHDGTTVKTKRSKRGTDPDSFRADYTQAAQLGRENS
jgi:hypothetical protein